MVNINIIPTMVRIVVICGDSHRLAQHGEFGDKLEDLFRDFFIPGIDDDSVIHKLLLESNPDLYKVIETAPE